MANKRIEEDGGKSVELKENSVIAAPHAFRWASKKMNSFPTNARWEF